MLNYGVVCQRNKHARITKISYIYNLQCVTETKCRTVEVWFFSVKIEVVCHMLCHGGLYKILVFSDVSHKVYKMLIFRCLSI